MKATNYLVRVTREGVRRTATLSRAVANGTVHDAVKMGLDVACTPVCPVCNNAYTVRPLGGTKGGSVCDHCLITID